MLPDSDGISPVPPYLRIMTSAYLSFHIQDCYLLWCAVPSASAKSDMQIPIKRVTWSRNPAAQQRNFQITNPDIHANHNPQNPNYKRKNFLLWIGYSVIEISLEIGNWKLVIPMLCIGLDSSAFARHYLRNLKLISFPSPTEMFQFSECVSLSYEFR